jgi:hypothetical protein
MEEERINFLTIGYYQKPLLLNNKFTILFPFKIYTIRIEISRLCEGFIVGI